MLARILHIGKEKTMFLDTLEGNLIAISLILFFTSYLFVLSVSAAFIGRYETSIDQELRQIFTRRGALGTVVWLAALGTLTQTLPDTYTTAIIAAGAFTGLWSFYLGVLAYKAKK